MQQEIIASAAVKLLINGEVMGLVTSITYNRTQGVKPIYGIDDPFPQEIAITGPYLIQGRLTAYMTRHGGGLDGAKIVNTSTINDYFSQNYCVISITDRKTGRLIAEIDKVIFGVDSVSISSRGLIMLSAEFTGRFLKTFLSS